MTQLQQVNLGNYANDGTGDDLRTAFQKVNSNFSVLQAETNISNGVNLGSGVGFFKDRNVANLEFKSLTSVDGTIVVTSHDQTVDISMSTMIQMDPNPMLGNNLDLNGFYVYGGDVQTSVYGINVPILNSLVELLVQSNQLAVNMGSILTPAGMKVSGDRGTVLDMGYIVSATYPNNNLDFGNIIN
jgi:hypothetical protein